MDGCLIGDGEHEYEQAFVGLENLNLGIRQLDSSVSALSSCPTVGLLARPDHLGFSS